MGVNYYDVADFDMEISKDGSNATLVMYVPYNDFLEYAQVQVGGLQTNLGFIQFVVGAAFPDPNLRLWCNKVKAKPVKNYASDGSGFITLEVTLSYGILDQPQSEDGTEIGDVSYSVTTEELVLPKASLKLEGSTYPDTMPNPIKLISKGELVVSFKFRPELNPAAWFDFAGKVNEFEFYGWAAGTIMFCSPNTKRTITTDGSDSYSYQYTFAINPYGWNNQWNPAHAAWEAVTASNGNPQYESIDFAGLNVGGNSD